MLRGRGNIIPSGATDHSMQREGPGLIRAESLDLCSFENPCINRKTAIRNCELSSQYYIFGVLYIYI